MATTTTAPLLVVPSEEDRVTYLIFAALALGPTIYSARELTTDEFVAIARDGALEACLTVESGGTLADAMGAVVVHTPLGNKPPDDWTSEEHVGAFAAVLGVIPGGPDIYCPTVDLGVDSEATGYADVMAAAWQEFLVEE